MTHSDLLIKANFVGLAGEIPANFTGVVERNLGKFRLKFTSKELVNNQQLILSCNSVSSGDGCYFRVRSIAKAIRGFPRGRGACHPILEGNECLLKVL